MLLVEKETREGGVEGLVKGMQRKLHLKEMVIKVGRDSQNLASRKTSALQIYIKSI